MPPSGFSEEAVERILGFTRANYKDLLAELASGKHASIKAAIEFEIANIEKALSGTVDKAIRGILLFVQACYQQLLAELASTVDADVHLAIDRQASNLEKVLSKLHINEKGELTER